MHIKEKAYLTIQKLLQHEFIPEEPLVTLNKKKYQIHIIFIYYM